MPESVIRREVTGRIPFRRGLIGPTSAGLKQVSETHPRNIVLLAVAVGVDAADLVRGLQNVKGQDGVIVGESSTT